MQINKFQILFEELFFSTKYNVDEIFSKSEINNVYIPFLTKALYNNLPLVYYYNKYLNFYYVYTAKDWFFTIKILFRKHKINTKSQLYFLNNKQNKKDKFEEHIDQYDDIISLNQNDMECLGLLDLSDLLVKKKEIKVLTLFDVKILGEEILYIFVDNFGNKEYIREQLAHPVYIKHGSISQCEYITSKVNEKLLLTKEEYNILKYSLDANLNSTIGN